VRWSGAVKRHFKRKAWLQVALLACRPWPSRRAHSGKRVRMSLSSATERWSYIRAGLEQSLRRLRTDHLDLLQVHMSPSRERLEANGVLETLLSCREEGKVSP
jgi:aryl-alcohol dehydrogenase-like predicted oxidoreductase